MMREAIGRLDAMIAGKVCYAFLNSMLIAF